MTSPTKQPVKKGGWGSLLSGAVANLESRLDTILAEDTEASARQRAGEAGPTGSVRRDASRQRTNSGNLAPPRPRSSTPSGSRDGSRTRVNDRLAERLAKATAAKKESALPSRVSSPANVEGGSGRASGEVTRSADVARSVPAIDETKPEAITEEKDEVNGVQEQESTLLTSGLPMNPAKVSTDSPRPSVELATEATTSTRVSSEQPNGHSLSTRDAAELEAEMAQMREDYAAAEKQRQEEMHTYLEKIDALQAKLKYLANETVAAAKAANAETTGDEAKLAEKDERIALLMEEGEKLSKTELRHMQTIKKLRGTAGEKDKAASELSKRLERAEKAEVELKQKLRRAEVAEREANEKARQIVTIEKEVEKLRVDRENASELIRNLTSQLKVANENVKKAEKEAGSKASEADRDRIAALENELEDARIEKTLAEDRAATEIKKARDESERQRSRFGVREMELKDEMATLESRVEAMRSRVEEASSDGSGGSESNVMLLRQVETLQSQYGMAKANWETIESTLTARLSVLEGERDEAVKREADMRKRAREATVAKRRVEEEFEGQREEVESLRNQMVRLSEECEGARKALEGKVRELGDLRDSLERDRKLWEAETAQRVEEARSHAQQQRGQPLTSSRNDSPATSGRKASAVDLVGLHMPTTRHARPSNNHRVTSHDLAALHTQHADRPGSRRSSAMPTPASTTARFPASAQAHPVDRSSASISPALSRQESSLSLVTSPTGGMPPTPSIEIDHPNFDSGSNSPERTINDLMSTSTAAAGPSVQLVERLSTAVRRLESEKATHKEELLRLSSQRDESRDEMVRLMRELEGVKSQEGKVETLQTEQGELKRRYEALLEMLGEKEEEVESLKGDVGELKAMYRALVEEKLPER
ncbi:hypothetical protein LTR97_012000 [Elasticomyces elasticus]|uniref:TATA element modulatory factor 1 TATA binding domain-containing protein n=1 Tax=Elasticomyces elasticus TaxID=574655 RepID=A0AAN7VXV6_9PEZI|nr:hypothetical protein LTR97_012000 [Elasticomyces elasticus]KAK5717778.1 hypothetical protein LTR15_008617 [Elasticomyces elasticus]